MNKHYGVPANVSVAALAIFCAINGLSKELMYRMISSEYKRNVSENIAYADAIYELIEDKGDGLDSDAVPAEYHYLSGNQAIVLGAWTAGLDFYYGYPMTPASSLLHDVALKQNTHQMFGIHAESELAAVNMALGSALAGCRSAVGSSGGGFALIQEAFSLAGMAEIPLLCILSSRPGPSTGVSTYTAQEDLWFALNQGHGEFSRVVASPDQHSRVFSLAAELLTLAWEAQTPTILLTEKHLSEGMLRLELDAAALPEAELLPQDTNEVYQRYWITAEGISPLRFFGDAGVVIKWSSHEHLESGLRTDQAEAMVEMKDKRNRKSRLLAELTKRYQRVAEYGIGEHLVFAYGSTVMELREAQKHCPIPFRIVAPVYLEPFPEEELEQYRGRRAVVVEHSSTGGFARFLNWKLQLEVKRSILQYDGRPFDPLDLATIIQEALRG